VIKASPLGTALCALSQQSPAFLLDLYRWAEAQIDSEDAYREFLGELKRAGITRQTAPRELLAPYSVFDGYGGKGSREFGRNARFLGAFRFSGVLLDSSFLQSLVQHCEHELEQFGEMAFISADEGSDQLPSRDEFPSGERLLFEHVMRSRVGSDSEHRAILLQSLALLEAAIEQVEAKAFASSLPYQYIVRPELGLIFTTLGQFGCPCSELEQQVMLTRIKLLKALCWPQTYGLLMSRREAIVQAQRRLSTTSGFVSELLCGINDCIESLEHRYPILRMSPMSKNKA
jgi:hypothetical protein